MQNGLGNKWVDGSSCSVLPGVLAGHSRSTADLSNCTPRRRLSASSTGGYSE